MPAKSTMSEQYDRYYFIGAHQTFAGRLRSGFAVVLSLVMIAAFRTPQTFVPFGIFSLLGVYGLLRPAKPGIFVEVRANELVVNVLTRRMIRYDEIQSAHFLRYKEHDLVEGIKGAANMLGRFFGGSAPKIRPGQVDETIVLVHFKRPRWVLFPFPPFIWYSKFLYFRVDRAGELLSAINANMPEN